MRCKTRHRGSERKKQISSLIFFFCFFLLWKERVCKSFLGCPTEGWQRVQEIYRCSGHLWQFQTSHHWSQTTKECFKAWQTKAKKIQSEMCVAKVNHEALLVKQILKTIQKLSLLFFQSFHLDFCTFCYALMTGNSRFSSRQKIV